ncbi:DUF6266 family protein [Pedobacter sp. PLR]|uniref:DUF6266 family protein n=1 Tax=Pedobacter sp. PLR TaxID=2994465 RepID=UPI0022466BEF|nr:DUF6266 family protein [Pedobacter sp. PLR]MCX2453318.1 DUF6266 family protein [Pedobacter sp. PLR]
MGSLNNGLFGAFNGRVGNLVGYTLNGKNVIRVIGHTTKPPTLPKLANFQKMTVVNEFLRKMQGFLKIGFQHEVLGTDRNTYNEALSYNKKHALKGEYPNISIDYPKVMLSKGSLRPADHPIISKPATAEGIVFQWEVPAHLQNGHIHDRAMLLIHFPESKTSYSIFSGARRHEGKDTLYIDPNLYDEQMEAYITFISPDGEEISDSVYAGSIAKNPVKEVNNTELIEKVKTEKENTTHDNAGPAGSKKSSAATTAHQLLKASAIDKTTGKPLYSSSFCARITQPTNLFQFSDRKNHNIYPPLLTILPAAPC